MLLLSLLILLMLLPAHEVFIANPNTPPCQKPTQ